MSLDLKPFSRRMKWFQRQLIIIRTVWETGPSDKIRKLVRESRSWWRSYDHCWKKRISAWWIQTQWRHFWKDSVLQALVVPAEILANSRMQQCRFWSCREAGITVTWGLVFTENKKKKNSAKQGKERLFSYDIVINDPYVTYETDDIFAREIINLKSY